MSEKLTEDQRSVVLLFAVTMTVVSLVLMVDAVMSFDESFDFHKMDRDIVKFQYVKPDAIKNTKKEK